MVFVPMKSQSASVTGHDGKNVVRLYAGAVCFADFFNKATSKPQDG